MKDKKAKGSAGEREMVRFFNESGFACIRAAGSGSQRYPSPDILAANAIRRLARMQSDQRPEKILYHRRNRAITHLWAEIWGRSMGRREIWGRRLVLFDAGRLTSDRKHVYG